MKQYAKVTPEGSRDLLFEECDDRRRVENALTGLYEANGYRKVITPTLEFFDVFNSGDAGLVAVILANDDCIICVPYKNTVSKSILFPQSVQCI